MVCDKRMHFFACFPYVNISFEKVIREASDILPCTILNNTVQKIAYSEDIVILGRFLCNVSETVVALEQTAINMDLHMNELKTKFMSMKSKTIWSDRTSLWRTTTLMRENNLSRFPISKR